MLAAMLWGQAPAAGLDRALLLAGGGVWLLAALGSVPGALAAGGGYSSGGDRSNSGSSLEQQQAGIGALQSS